MAGKSTITFGFKLEDGKDGLKQLTMDADALRKIMAATVTETKKFQSKAVTFSSVSTAVESAQRAVSELQGVVGNLAAAYRAQLEAETKLETVMRQRMSASAADIQGIKDLCSAQQELGIIGDEVQLAGAQQLATFLNNKQALEQLIPAMNDLVAQQRGFNASQGDATSIANLFGKAMQGQTSALRRVGITFTAAEEAALKTGDEYQRAAALAEIVTNNVGHMNSELAKTDAGKQKQLENTLGDLAEKAGAVLGKIQPMLTFAASATTAVSGVIRLVSGVKAATAAIGAMHIKTKLLRASIILGSGSVQTGDRIFKSYTATTRTATAATVGFKTAVRGLMAATGVGLAITALGFAIEKLISSSDKAKESVEGMDDAMDEAKAARDEMNRSVAQSTAQLELDIAATKNFNGTKAEEAKMVSELNTRYGDKICYMSSVAGWYKTLTDKSEIYIRQLELEAEAQIIAERLAKKRLEQRERQRKSGASGGGGKSGIYSWDNKGSGDFDWKSGKNPNSGKFSINTGYNPNAWTWERAAPFASKTEKALNKSYDNALQKDIADDEALLQDVTSDLKKNGQLLKSVSSPAPSGGGGHSGRGSGSHTSAEVSKPVRTENPKTIKEYTDNISLLDEELKTCTGPERIKEINQEKKKFQDAINAINSMGNEPVLDEKATTIRGIDANIGILEERIKDATAEDAAQINQQIKSWREKRDAIAEAGIAVEESVAKISTVNPLAKTLDEIESNISVLQDQLKSSTVDEAASINQSIKAWEEKADAIRKAGLETKSTVQTLGEAYGQIKSVGSGIQSITSALEGNGNAWQKITGIIDGFVQIFEGVKAIVGIINAITTATEAATAAKEAETAANQLSNGVWVSGIGFVMANTLALQLNTEKAKENIRVKSGESIVNVIASGAKLGFPQNLAAIAAGEAAVMAALSVVGSFATGGIVGGTSPTGDRLMARVNSGEMILNRSQQANLFRMVNSPAVYDRIYRASGGDNGGGTVEFKIKDRELVGFLDRAIKRNNRS